MDFGGVAEMVARIRSAVDTVVRVAAAKVKHTGKSLKIIFEASGEPEVVEGIDTDFEVVVVEGLEQAEETLNFGKSLRGLTVLELVVQGCLVERRSGGRYPLVRLVALVLSSLM
jgi:hypothetical protein